MNTNEINETVEVENVSKLNKKVDFGNPAMLIGFTLSLTVGLGTIYIVNRIRKKRCVDNA